MSFVTQHLYCSHIQAQTILFCKQHLYCSHIQAQNNIVWKAALILQSHIGTKQYCLASSTYTAVTYRHKTILFGKQHLYCSHIQAQNKIVWQAALILQSHIGTKQYCLASSTYTAVTYRHKTILFGMQHLYCSHIQAQDNIVWQAALILQSHIGTRQYCLASSTYTAVTYRHNTILFGKQHLYCSHIYAQNNIVWQAALILQSHIGTKQYCLASSTYTAVTYKHKTILLGKQHLCCSHIQAQNNIVWQAALILQSHIGTRQYCLASSTYTAVIYRHKTILFGKQHLYCSHIQAQDNIVWQAALILQSHIGTRQYCLASSTYTAVTYTHKTILFGKQHLYCSHIQAQNNIVWQGALILQSHIGTKQYCSASSTYTAGTYRHKTILFVKQHLYCSHIQAQNNVVWQAALILQSHIGTRQYCLASSTYTAVIYRHKTILFGKQHLYCSHIQAQDNIVWQAALILQSHIGTRQYCLASSTYTAVTYTHKTILFGKQHLYCSHIQAQNNIVWQGALILQSHIGTKQYCSASSTYTAGTYRHKTILFVKQHLYCSHIQAQNNVVCEVSHILQSHIRTKQCRLSRSTYTAVTYRLKQYCFASSTYTAVTYRHKTILFGKQHLYCSHIQAQNNIVWQAALILQSHIGTKQYCLASSTYTAVTYRHKTKLFGKQHLYCSHIQAQNNIVWQAALILQSHIGTRQYCLACSTYTAVTYRHKTILFGKQHLYCSHIQAQDNIVWQAALILQSHIGTIQYCLASSTYTAVTYRHKTILFGKQHLYCSHIQVQDNIVWQAALILQSHIGTRQYCLASSTYTAVTYRHKTILFGKQHLYCSHIQAQDNIVWQAALILQSHIGTRQYCLECSTYTAVTYRHKTILFGKQHLYCSHIQVQAVTYRHKTILFGMQHLYCSHIQAQDNIVWQAALILQSHIGTRQYCLASSTYTAVTYRHKTILFGKQHLYCSHIQAQDNIVWQAALILQSHIGKQHLYCSTRQYCLTSSTYTAVTYTHKTILFGKQHLYCSHIQAQDNIVWQAALILQSHIGTRQYCLASSTYTAVTYRHKTILFGKQHLYCSHIQAQDNIVWQAALILQSHIRTKQYCLASSTYTAVTYRHKTILFGKQHLYCSHIQAQDNIVWQAALILQSHIGTRQYCLASSTYTAVTYRHKTILFGKQHLYCSHIQVQDNIVWQAALILQSHILTRQYCLASSTYTAVTYRHKTILFGKQHLYCSHIQAQDNIVWQAALILQSHIGTRQYCLASSTYTAVTYRHKTILFGKQHLYCSHIQAQDNIVWQAALILQSHIGTRQYCLASSTYTAVTYRHKTILFGKHHLYCSHIQVQDNIVWQAALILQSHIRTKQYCLASSTYTAVTYRHKTILFGKQHLYCSHISAQDNIVWQAALVLQSHIGTRQYCLASSTYTAVTYRHKTILFGKQHLYCSHIQVQDNIVWHAALILQSHIGTRQDCLESSTYTAVTYRYKTVLFGKQHLYCSHIQAQDNIVWHAALILQSHIGTRQYCLASSTHTAVTYRHKTILFGMQHLYCSHIQAQDNIVWQAALILQSHIGTRQYCLASSTYTAVTYRHNTILFGKQHLYCSHIQAQDNIVWQAALILQSHIGTRQYFLASSTYTAVTYTHKTILFGKQHLYCSHIQAQYNIVWQAALILQSHIGTRQYCLACSTYTAVTYRYKTILFGKQHLYCSHIQAQDNIVWQAALILQSHIGTRQYCLASSTYTAVTYRHKTILFGMQHLYCSHIQAQDNIVWQAELILQSHIGTRQYCLACSTYTAVTYRHKTILFGKQHIYCSHIYTQDNIVWQAALILQSHIGTRQYCLASSTYTAVTYRYKTILFGKQHLYCSHIYAQNNIVWQAALILQSHIGTKQYCLARSTYTAVTYRHKTILFGKQHLYCRHIQAQDNIVCQAALILQSHIGTKQCCL